MTEQTAEIRVIINSLNELQADATVPRNVRAKIESVINTLKEDIELSVKVSRALSGLDETANDVNLQSYTRTQIWSAMSLLEKF